MLDKKAVQVNILAHFKGAIVGIISFFKTPSAKIGAALGGVAVVLSLANPALGSILFGSSIASSMMTGSILPIISASASIMLISSVASGVIASIYYILVNTYNRNTNRTGIFKRGLNKFTPVATISPSGSSPVAYGLLQGLIAADRVCEQYGKSNIYDGTDLGKDLVEVAHQLNGTRPTIFG